MTNEHVFPQWLIDHFELSKNSVDAIHQDIFGRAHDVRSLTQGKMVLGGICKSCNNGWMSSLEGEFKTLLPSIEWGCVITSDDAQIIVTWAFKTAIALNAWSNYHNLVPPDHFHFLFKNGRPPENVVVDVAFIEPGWLGEQSGDERLSWKQSRVIAYKMQEADCTQEFRDLAYVIVIIVDRLMFRVTNIPRNDLSLVGVTPGDLYRRLWPWPGGRELKIDPTDDYDQPLRYAWDSQLTVD